MGSTRMLGVIFCVIALMISCRRFRTIASWFVSTWDASSRMYVDSFHTLIIDDPAVSP